MRIATGDGAADRRARAYPTGRRRSVKACRELGLERPRSAAGQRRDRAGVARLQAVSSTPQAQAASVRAPSARSRRIWMELPVALAAAAGRRRAPPAGRPRYRRCKARARGGGSEGRGARLDQRLNRSTAAAQPNGAAPGARVFNAGRGRSCGAPRHDVSPQQRRKPSGVATTRNGCRCPT